MTTNLVHPSYLNVAVAVEQLANGHIVRKECRCENVDKTPEEKENIDQYSPDNICDFSSSNPNLTTSILNMAMNDNLPQAYQFHAPVIDLDVPCELVPSTQLGHYHLYIHKPISFQAYINLLRAFALAGIVEKNFVAASINRGFTAVRKIGIHKYGRKHPASDILKENAILRRENYLLKQKLHIQEHGPIEFLTSEHTVSLDELQEIPTAAEPTPHPEDISPQMLFVSTPLHTDDIF